MTEPLSELEIHHDISDRRFVFRVSKPLLHSENAPQCLYVSRPLSESDRPLLTDLTDAGFAIVSEILACKGVGPLEVRSFGLKIQIDPLYNHAEVLDNCAAIIVKMLYGKKFNRVVSVNTSELKGHLWAVAKPKFVIVTSANCPISKRLLQIASRQAYLQPEIVFIDTNGSTLSIPNDQLPVIATSVDTVEVSDIAIALGRNMLTSTRPLEVRECKDGEDLEAIFQRSVDKLLERWKSSRN